MLHTLVWVSGLYRRPGMVRECRTIGVWRSENAKAGVCLRLQEKSKIRKKKIVEGLTFAVSVSITLLYYVE